MKAIADSRTRTAFIAGFLLCILFGLILVVLSLSLDQGRKQSGFAGTAAAIYSTNTQVAVYNLATQSGAAWTTTPRPSGPSNTSNTGDDSQPKQQLQRRLIIKNAEVSMVVADPNATVNKITAWVEENGGWIIESNVVKNGSLQQAVISVRVPAERLLDALTLIKAEAKTLLSDTVIGTDVTDQYADAQSRLKNLEAAEAQMRTFLEGATNTEEVLKVYEQLVSVRGEIEQIKGRLGYMEQSAAFSSIRVTMQTDPPPTPTPTITPTPEYRGWQLDKVAGDAGNALVFVLQFLISVVVWSVIVVLPTAILVGIPSYLVYRIVNRRKPINKVEGENS